MDQRPSFGRKAMPGFTSSPRVEPPPSRATASSLPTFDLPTSVDLNTPWLKRLLVLLLASPLVILLIDSLFSGTELITPIDHRGLVVMRVLGGIDGVLLWVITRAQFENSSLRQRIAMFVGLPLIMVLAFDGLSWRLANWGAFGFSDAPFETATYPIERLNYGRKGKRDTIAIDPFKVGEASHLPIPHWQYAQLSGAVAGQCVEVQQRRAANGAIQVRTDGQFVASEPAPLRVTSC